MIIAGVLLAVVSGVFNGLFTAPMKMIPGWKWENIWLVFIVTACLLMPVGMVAIMGPSPGGLYAAAPASAISSALLFGFAWGFGAILFGLSVDYLGVSLANSLVIGLSSAMGSLVPLILRRQLQLNAQLIFLLLGIVTFLLGVTLCGMAGRRREGATDRAITPGKRTRAYFFCIGSGIMSAVFNIGYSLALPIADTGVRMGYSQFTATNTIWLLMLAAGSVPNVVFCLFLINRNRSGALMAGTGGGRAWGLSVLMGLLWGGSIFLYGAATPLLGEMGPSIGWPLSLAVGLLVANLMGVLLGEWRNANPQAARLMRYGIVTIMIAILLCATSSKLSVS
jgi:L-rhamnose-H+ transport protein